MLSSAWFSSGVGSVLDSNWLRTPLESQLGSDGDSIRFGSEWQGLL